MRSAIDDLPDHVVRDALGHFATGVTVVTTSAGDGAPVGTTASAVSSLSLEPPLLLVCLHRTSETLATLRTHGAFAVNVLAVDQTTLSTVFARRGAAVDWRDIEHDRGHADLPRLHGALAVIECDLHDALGGGDHEIVVGRPRRVTSRGAERAPLLHYRGAYGELAS